MNREWIRDPLFCIVEKKLGAPVPITPESGHGVRMTVPKLDMNDGPPMDIMAIWLVAQG